MVNDLVAAEDAMMIAFTTPAYTVLRRGEDGVFSAIQLLKRGDAIRLSILAQSSGNMTVEYSGLTETLPVTMGSLYTVPRTSQIMLDEASGQSIIRIRYSNTTPALEIILKYQ